MEFSHSVVVNAPVDRVWVLVRDPEKLAPAIPGLESIEVLDETTFRAQIAQRIGPFRARFDLTMSLVEVIEPRRITATGQGTEGGGGLLKVPSAVVDLEPISPTETLLSFSMEFSLLGKLGTLGYAVVKHKAGEMARVFSENLKKSLEEVS